jgi:hypothetical protein
MSHGRVIFAKKGMSVLRTRVAPFSAVVSTPGTSSPIPISDPTVYSFPWCWWRAWVCCQMKSSRCKPCCLTPGPMSNVVAAERTASVAISAPSSKLYGWETVRRKWLMIFSRSGCCSQISRAVSLRPKSRVPRVVSRARPRDKRCQSLVNFQFWWYL